MNKYKKVVLDNGIRLYVHGDKTMKKFHVCFSINYGSSGEYFKFNYDNKDYEVLPGCAHFLEHLLLENSRYGNLYTKFKLLNYASNAHTALNITEYFFTGTKSLKSSIKKLILSLEKPIFNEESIRKASHAIEEETKRGLDNPYLMAYLLSLRNSYKSFEYAHESLNTIGTEETTRNIHYETLKLCYDAFYSDDRKVIVVTGPIDEDDIINYIKGIYKKIKPHKNKTKLYIPDNLNKIRKSKEIVSSSALENDYVVVNFNNQVDGFSIFEKDAYIKYLALYKFSSKSKFTEKLKNEDVIINYEGSLFNPTFQREINNTFTFGFSFTTKDTNKFIKELDKEIRNNDFDKKDFELYKKSRISDDIYANESKYTFYNVLASNIIYYNEDIDIVDEIKKLSFERFIEFYNKLDFDNRVITIVTKEGL